MFSIFLNYGNAQDNLLFELLSDDNFSARKKIKRLNTKDKKELVSSILKSLENSNEKVTVEIKILEAFKYTTTLEIVQRPEFKKWMTNPSMLVRVYHDASTAEVVSYQGHRNLKPRYSQPNPKMYHSDEKMQVNSFLGEWLTHCLKVGRSIKAPELSFIT